MFLICEKGAVLAEPGSAHTMFVAPTIEAAQDEWAVEASKGNADPLPDEIDVYQLTKVEQ